MRVLSTLSAGAVSACLIVTFQLIASYRVGVEDARALKARDSGWRSLQNAAHAAVTAPTQAVSAPVVAAPSQSSQRKPSPAKPHWPTIERQELLTDHGLDHGL